MFELINHNYYPNMTLSINTPQQSYQSHSKEKPDLSPPPTPGKIHDKVRIEDVPEFLPVSKSILGDGYKHIKGCGQGFALFKDADVSIPSITNKKYEPQNMVEGFRANGPSKNG